MFHPINLDFISRIFTEKYAILLFDFQGNPFSVFIPFSGTNRYDLPLLRSFFGRVRNDDPAGGLLFSSISTTSTLSFNGFIFIPIIRFKMFMAN
jgi:hypothetical protein